MSRAPHHLHSTLEARLGGRALQHRRDLLATEAGSLEHVTCDGARLRRRAARVAHVSTLRTHHSRVSGCDQARASNGMGRESANLVVVAREHGRHVPCGVQPPEHLVVVPRQRVVVAHPRADLSAALPLAS